MLPIEIEGVIAKVQAVVNEYGRRTDQDHIRHAQFFGWRAHDKTIVTAYKNNYDELEKGEVPLLAFTDMDAAVGEFFDRQTAEWAREAERSRWGEYTRYLMLKEEFEGKEPPPNPHRPNRRQIASMAPSLKEQVAAATARHRANVAAGKYKGKQE